LGAVRFRDKFVTRNAKHGIEDARVRHAAGPELGVDHKLTSGGRVGHAIPAFFGARLPAVSDESEKLRVSHPLDTPHALRRGILVALRRP
jgi:hypothetical protein